MFEAIQKRLSNALSRVRGRSTISENDVNHVLAEVRTGLLEGDVHFRVAKDFLARVKERCLREEVLKSLTPEQQILKVLQDELTLILGESKRDLDFTTTPPAVLLMCGLQGSGKTTSTVKLALYLKNQLKKRPVVVSVDVYRPAAMKQLEDLARRNEIPCLAARPEEKPRDIAKRALKEAHEQNYDVLLVDTAGRLQVDDELMNELKDVRKILNPTEVLLVVDTMMGQQAVSVAEGFEQKIGVSGFILTKLDGDARGGAALSLVSVTGRPIKFIGSGERATDFEPFYPERVSSRILDMGDVLTLLEKAQRVIGEEEAADVASRIEGNSFTLEDFKQQMQMMSRMGPISGLIKMLPGMSGMREQLESIDMEGEMKRIGAIIDSMTPLERKRPENLNGTRRARIARGAGVEVAEVNRLVKRFLEARKMMKNMGKMTNFMKNFGGRRGGRGGFGSPF